MNEELLDRFARGELSREESRDLAQQALGNHNLFADLTATAIAREGLPIRGRKRIAWPRIAIIGAAAAIILGVVFRIPWRNPKPMRPFAAVSAAPILLARNADSNASSFRGAETESREPRATGSIQSIAHGIAAIDLGSLDGLAKGGQVEVVRKGEVIARIKLTTIFRDHSRGEIASGAPIRVNDQVLAPRSARFRAILDQIDVAMARGEPETARKIAQQASVEGFQAELSSYEDLNNAGVIAELHGNRTKAGELYRRALQTGPSGQDRQAIEKNVERLRGAK